MASRKEVDFRTKVAKNHYLDITILAANMDTVCKNEMAITLEPLSGLGTIHRFLSISKKQAEEVEKVKANNLLTAAGFKESIAHGLTENI